MTILRPFLVVLALAAIAVGGVEPADAQDKSPPAQGEVPQDQGAATDTQATRSPAATLNNLFERLAAAKTPEEAKGVASQIQRRWARSGSDTADLLMSRAQQALRTRQTELAIELLDRIISLEPDWAEAWNQRANALFLTGDSLRAVLDISETLKREPRHYGAMMGLGMILRQQGDDKRALTVYRRALQIYPQYDPLKDAIDTLKSAVDGRDA